MLQPLKAKAGEGCIVAELQVARRGQGRQLLEVLSKKQAGPEQAALLPTLRGRIWVRISPGGKMKCFHAVLKIVIIN